MRGRGAPLAVTILTFSSLAWPAPAFELRILGGAVYGPGMMSETPLPPGRFSHITLDPMLSGETVFFNNGAEPPNIPGEAEIFGTNAGVLSNGVPFNEHVDGGIVTIGQGALKMLAVISKEGPNTGRETYGLDDRLNWRLRTDLALDPGFPEGLVISENLDITTGVLIVKPSVQTEAGAEGGIDTAGGVPSGAPVFGRIGDSDEDGFLDGEIVGVGRVPVDYIFVPGAPLVQRRIFVSDIPVTPHSSALLTLSNVANLGLILAVAEGEPGPASDYVAAHLPGIVTEFGARAAHAAARLSAIGAAEAPLARAVAAALAAAEGLGGDPKGYGGAVRPALNKLEAALPELKAAFRRIAEEGSGPAPQDPTAEDPVGCRNRKGVCQ